MKDELERRIEDGGLRMENGFAALSLGARREASRGGSSPPNERSEPPGACAKPHTRRGERSEPPGA